MASEGRNTGDDPGSTDDPPTARPATRPPPGAKLRSIEITDYKALDHLKLEIPQPLMPGDPDIFVVGSKNGVGKTSLLECCALAHFGKIAELGTFAGEDVAANIRSGSTHFTIAAQYEPGGSSVLSGREREHKEYLPVGNVKRWSLRRGEPNTEALFGRSLNPLVRKDLLLFHSHRKVAEGSLRLQQMLKPQEAQDSSALKLAILRMLLAKSGLLEDFTEPEAESRLECLNGLISTFAGGRVDKLRTMTEDRLDIRIAKSGGASFSFDTLSSGQKEVISTLFMVWNETLYKPSLVLIDEPELHLNAEWQREFIRHLHQLAPDNQYILATHSEEVFASVPESRRVLLVGPQG